MLQPVLVAGIDPMAEARLAHLDRCVVNGRYLNASDSPEPARDRDPPGTVIPALLSDRSFVDATLTSKVERATDPWAIVHGGPTENAVWTDPQQTDETVDAMYRQYIPHVGEEVDEWPLWSAGDVEYMQQAGGLVARTSPPDTSVLQRANFRQFGAGDTLAMPPELQDRWFRAVTQRSYAGVTGDKYWSRIGTYDPTCLPGFTQLAGGGGLDAYTVPAARLAGGKELLPNRSLAGYLNTPPVILTTLKGAQWLADSRRFAGAPGDDFISAVRVRVRGIDGPTPASERRLARAAASIHESTGLAVDIVRGSSTRDISVRLPAGDFGRAAVEIAEGWSVKGVAVTFSSAVSTQNLALFALALLAAFVLVATTGYIAARRRHAEFGVLRALGWPSWRIGGLVASEMGWLGLVVGFVTVVVTLVAGLLLRAPVATPLVAVTLPIAIGVALAASAPAGGRAQHGDRADRAPNLCPAKSRASLRLGARTGRHAAHMEDRSARCHRHHRSGRRAPCIARSGGGCVRWRARLDGAGRRPRGAGPSISFRAGGAHGGDRLARRRPDREPELPRAPAAAGGAARAGLVAH